MTTWKGDQFLAKIMFSQFSHRYLGQILVIMGFRRIYIITKGYNNNGL